MAEILEQDMDLIRDDIINTKADDNARWYSYQYDYKNRTIKIDILWEKAYKHIDINCDNVWIDHDEFISYIIRIIHNSGLPHPKTIAIYESGEYQNEFRADNYHRYNGDNSIIFNS
jgi:hypothetical protein